jgi:hypothetical protein
MIMSTRHQPSTVPSSIIVQRLIGLATSLVARSLQVPEPLVYSTGVLVFTHVQAIETRAAKTVAKSLCPVRLLRQIRSWFR